MAVKKSSFKDLQNRVRYIEEFLTEKYGDDFLPVKSMTWGDILPTPEELEEAVSHSAATTPTDLAHLYGKSPKTVRDWLRKNFNKTNGEWVITEEIAEKAHLRWGDNS